MYHLVFAHHVGRQGFLAIGLYLNQGTIIIIYTTCIIGRQHAHSEITSTRVRVYSVAAGPESQVKQPYGQPRSTHILQPINLRRVRYYIYGPTEVESRRGIGCRL